MLWVSSINKFKPILHTHSSQRSFLLFRFNSFLNYIANATVLTRGINLFRFLGVVDNLEGRVLRVVTLEDKATMHNAFPDRGYCAGMDVRDIDPDGSVEG